MLTDKTGTLTRNEMELKGICIADKIFGGKFVRDGDGITFLDYPAIAKQEGKILEDGNTFDPNIKDFLSYGERNKNGGRKNSRTTTVISRSSSKKGGILKK